MHFHTRNLVWHLDPLFYQPWEKLYSIFYHVRGLPRQTQPFQSLSSQVVRLRDKIHHLKKSKLYTTETKQNAIFVNFFVCLTISCKCEKTIIHPPMYILWYCRNNFAQWTGCNRKKEKITDYYCVVIHN